MFALAGWLAFAPLALAVTGDPEDGVDLTDEDGDGSLSVRRDFVVGFESGLFVGGDLDLQRASVVAVGILGLTPSASQAAHAKLKGPLTWTSGELTVVVKVDTLGGAGCHVRVDGSTATYSSSITTTGVHVASFPAVAPGATPSWVGVECLAGGASMVIDWLTVQNGPYEWAPLMDTHFDFSGMGFPNGGRGAVIRTSEEYDASGGLLLIGSDVGGFAWAEQHDPEVDATEWHTANGGWDQWNDASEQAVMEVFAEWRGNELGGGNSSARRDPSEFDVYALTGEDSQERGGLWYCDDVSRSEYEDQVWTEVTGSLFAFKLKDDCATLDGGQPSVKEISSGRLLVNHPGNPSFLVIGGGGDSDGTARGVYLWEKGTPWADERPYTGLPGSAGYAPLPAALATGSAGQHGVLLVGYRVMASTGVSGSALYACPTDFDPATEAPPFACAPVADGDGTAPHDVRDIVSVPGQAGRFYVVDGGRAPGAADGACDTGESTVLAVLLSDFDGGTLDAEVWDTDDSADNPAWLPASASAGAYYANAGGAEDACFATPAATFGSLVPPVSDPKNDAHDLSTLAVSSDGAWLVAFYPLPNNYAHWGCAPVFRAPIGDPPAVGAALAWEPLQDWVFEEMDWNDVAYGASGHTHAATRREHVHALDSYVKDEPLPEFFAGTMVHDAVFVPGATGDNLLSSGALTWWTLGDGHAYVDPTTGLPDSDGVGWNSLVGLDATAWVLSWAGHLSGDTFQDLATDAIAVCPGCRRITPAAGSLVPADTLIGGGGGDYKLALLYDGGGPQQPAERPCEVHMVGARPEEIETWVDPDGTTPSQAWMILRGTWKDDQLVDQGLQRGIWFSEETATVDVGEEWCWDGIDKGGWPGWGAPAYIDPFTLDAICMDEGLLVAGNGYPPCGGASATYGMQDATPGVGQPLDLKVLGPDVAVFAAAPAALTTTATSVEPGSGGLWVVTHTTSGLSYEKVPFPDAEAPGGLGDCTEERFFADKVAATGLGNWVRVTVHPSSQRAYETGGVVRVFVTSDDPACGVAEVTWTAGSPASTAWNLLDLEHDGDGTESPDCKLRGNATDAFQLRGAHAAQDGRWLFVYAGVTSTGSGYAPLTAVCAIDLWTGADGIYATYRPVVGQPQMQMAIESFVSHPHVADLWYFGGYGVPACDACTPPGVFALQRRRRWIGGQWTEGWSFYRVSNDDLQIRGISEIVLGPAGDRLDPVRRMYVSTRGGSWWDGAVWW